MAATVEVPAFQGGTLTLDLYPDGSDTAAASAVTLTEATNRKSIYTGSVTGLSGLHLGLIKSGSTVVGQVWGVMTTTGVVVFADLGEAKLGVPINLGSGNTIAQMLLDMVFSEAGTGSGTGYDRQAESLEALRNKLDAMDRILQADVTVDTSTTPWQLVYKESGTSTVLMRKNLKDVTGAAIGDTTTVIGQATQ